MATLVDAVCIPVAPLLLDLPVRLCPESALKHRCGVLWRFPAAKFRHNGEAEDVAVRRGRAG